MLLNNYEVRVYATAAIADEQAEALTREIDALFARLVDTLRQDSRIKVTVTEV